MSSDLTPEQLAMPRKVRSPSKLAEINRAAALASAAAPKPKPRRSLSVELLREAISELENSGALNVDDAMRASAALVEIERASPGAERVAVEVDSELDALWSQYFDLRRARRAERERERWPKCAPGPCAAGPEGLVLPNEVKSRADAEAILAQLKSTRGLRELTSREKDTMRALRRQGIQQPSEPIEFKSIAKNRLRQLSKAAKRARNSQRTMEGARAALQRLNAEAAC